MKKFNIILAVFYIIVGGIIIFIGPKPPRPECIVCGGFLEFMLPFILVALGAVSVFVNNRSQQK